MLPLVVDTLTADPKDALLGTGDWTKVTRTASEIGVLRKGEGPPRVFTGIPAGLTTGCPADWGLMFAGKLIGTNCTELGPWEDVAVVNLIEVAPPATPPKMKKKIRQN